MKKILLSVAVIALLFSCSKDNVNSETTADLSKVIAEKSLDQSSDGIYYGVFGHNNNKTLHGKIFINVANDGNYTAQIDYVNGDQLKFTGNQASKGNIHFVGKRGSFDFNTTNFASPITSNVFIDNETEAYIVSRKQTSRGGGYILLGTYEDDANPAFGGNWDMFADGVETGIFEGLPSQFVILVSVSHTGVVDPFLETIFEDADPTNSCTGTTDIPLIFDVAGDGFGDSVLMGAQTSTFGATTTWNLNYFGGAYFDELCDIFDVPAGTWSRGPKSGSIYVTVLPAPFSETTTFNNDNKTVIEKLQK